MRSDRLGVSARLLSSGVPHPNQAQMARHVNRRLFNDAQFLAIHLALFYWGISHTVVVPTATDSWVIPGKRKGLAAAASANPFSRCWLRGLDLNRRPLGYEPGRPSRQPSDLSEKRSRRPSVAYPSLLPVSSSIFQSFSGWCGSKTGAGDLLGLPQSRP